MFNRTLIVGPSFCGKTHLLLNKLQLIRLDDNTRKIHITTRICLMMNSNVCVKKHGGISIIIY